MSEPRQKAVGYKDAHALCLPLILAEYKKHGWRTVDQLVAADCGDKRTVQATLKAAKKQGHTTDRPGTADLDPRWNRGELADSIDFVTVDEETAPGSDHSRPSKREQKTPLDKYWQSVPAPRSHSKTFRETLDWIVRKVMEWRPETSIEEIEPEWLSEFDLHLKSMGMADETRRGILRHMRLIVREKIPYRWFVTKTQWPFIERVLSDEPAGSFGNYFVLVYEQKHPMQRPHFRREAVRRFLHWNRNPIRLDQITDATLRRFATSAAGCPTDRLRELALQIRRVVNDWQPDRLRSLRQPAPTDTPNGTVEHYIEKVYMPLKAKQGVTKERLAQIGLVASAITAFHGPGGLQFLDFDQKFCYSCLRWVLANGVDGKSLSLNAVNRLMRYSFVGISKAARADKLMSDRLFLEPIGPLKRRPKNGQAVHGTNGHTMATPTIPIVLRGQGASPIVLGVEQQRLSKSEYAVIEAILAAHPNRLSKDELEIASDVATARKVLRELSKKSDQWKAVIYLPGDNRDGYGLVSPGKNSH